MLDLAGIPAANFSKQFANKFVKAVGEQAAKSGKVIKGAIPGTKEAAIEAVGAGVALTGKGIKKVTEKASEIGEDVLDKAIKKRILTTEELNSLAQPRLTKRIKEEAISRGELVDATAFKGSSVKPSKFDEGVAKALKKLKLTNKDSAVTIFDKIRTKVQKNDTFIKNRLKGSNITYKLDDLDKALEAGSKELEILFGSDTNALNTFTAVKKAFLREAKKEGLTLEMLFSGRQSFDKLKAVKKLLASSPTGESLRKEIILNVRSSANEFLTGKLTNAAILEKLTTNFLKNKNPLVFLALGKKARLKKVKITKDKFQDMLKEQSRLLTARTNLAEKEAAIIGQTKIDKFVEEFPVLKRLPSAGGIITGGVLF